MVYVTTAGSHILDNFIPPYNAHVIEKLSAAGAVVVGKANTDEFTMGSTCGDLILRDKQKSPRYHEGNRRVIGWFGCGNRC